LLLRGFLIAGVCVCKDKQQTLRDSHSVLHFLRPNVLARSVKVTVTSRSESHSVLHFLRPNVLARSVKVTVTSRSESHTVLHFLRPNVLARSVKVTVTKHKGTVPSESVILLYA